MNANTISAIQRRAWANKLAKGFNTTNVPQEFCLAFGELSEAFDAWRKNPDGLADELADVVIYVASLAEMTGVDLEEAVLAKMAANEKRTYVRNSQGVLVKR
jgi:NTP pyrophosphatase (non-canonical NTP hydrolase)